MYATRLRAELNLKNEAVMAGPMNVTELEQDLKY
jgi:hypothetical protein